MKIVIEAAEWAAEFLREPGMPDRSRSAFDDFMRRARESLTRGEGAVLCTDDYLDEVWDLVDEPENTTARYMLSGVLMAADDTGPELNSDRVMEALSEFYEAEGALDPEPNIIVGDGPPATERQRQLIEFQGSLLDGALP